MLFSLTKFFLQIWFQFSTRLFEMEFLDLNQGFASRRLERLQIDFNRVAILKPVNFDSGARFSNSNSERTRKQTTQGGRQVVLEKHRHDSLSERRGEV